MVRKIDNSKKKVIELHINDVNLQTELLEISKSTILYLKNIILCCSSRYGIPKMRRSAFSVNEVRCRMKHIQCAVKFRKSFYIRIVVGQ